MRLIDRGSLTGPPDLREVLDRVGWRQRAACRDEPDDNLFFYEPSVYRVEDEVQMSSPSLLLPLLICSTCPVRRDRLRFALEPPVYNHDDDDVNAATPRTMFVWGGTLELDRIRVKDLPVDDPDREA